MRGPEGRVHIRSSPSSSRGTDMSERRLRLTRLWGRLRSCGRCRRLRFVLPLGVWKGEVG